MKSYKDWHKYGSFALLVGFVGSVFSGPAKQKKLHAVSALLTVLGMAACIYSGHKMIGAYAPVDREA